MSELAGEAGASPADGYRGILFVISSPSGGGKGTLIKRLRESVPGVGYSVSWTTRKPRPGEVDGVNYRFVTADEFTGKIQSQGFLEWALVHGHHYGTARDAVEREMAAGRDVILEIDVQGARAMRAQTAWNKWRTSVVSIFILPPSFGVLRARLTARMTERPEELEVRLANAWGEIKQHKYFRYIVVNDEVERAAEELASVVRAERARRERRQAYARRVLATFPRPPRVE